MYRLESATVFYGSHPYKMNVTGLDTISTSPNPEWVAARIAPHMGALGYDEVERRMTIEVVPGYHFDDLTIPERIVAHGNGFNVTWVTV